MCLQVFRTAPDVTITFATNNDLLITFRDKEKKVIVLHK